jgi:hypothetical protein
MKKIAVVSATILLSFLEIQSFAQNEQKAAIKETKKELKEERKALRKLDGTIVSPAAKSNFNKDFPSASNVQWRRYDTYDEVAFTIDGKKYKSFYDYDANLVGTTSPKTFAELPERGQKEIKEKYKDYKIGPILFFDDNEANATDMILYGTQFDDTDSYFVELTKGPEKIAVQVTSAGFVNFFKKL